MEDGDGSITLLGHSGREEEDWGHEWTFICNVYYMCTYLFLCAHAPSSLMMMTTWSHSFSIIFSLNFIIIIIFFWEEKILKKLTIWFAYYKTHILDCLEEVWNCNCSANCWKTIQFCSSKILMLLMLCSIFAKISVEKIAQNIQEGRIFTIYLYKKNFQKQGAILLHICVHTTYVL